MAKPNEKSAKNVSDVFHNIIKVCVSDKPQKKAEKK